MNLGKDLTIITSVRSNILYLIYVINKIHIDDIFRIICIIEQKIMVTIKSNE